MTTSPLHTRGNRIYDIRPRLTGDFTPYPVGAEVDAWGATWHRQDTALWVQTTNIYQCRPDARMQKDLAGATHSYLGRQVGFVFDHAMSTWHKDAYTALEYFRQAAGVPAWFLTRIAPAEFWAACDDGKAAPTLPIVEETYAYVRALQTGAPHPLREPQVLSDAEIGYIATLSGNIFKQRLRPGPLAAKAGMPADELVALIKGERAPQHDDIEKLSSALGLPVAEVTESAREFTETWGVRS